MHHAPRSILVLLAICLFLTACSYAPSDEQAAEADYGREMAREEMQTLADQHMAGILKDPESRRIEWGRCGKAWIWNGMYESGNRYGYGLEALVNAKNSFGGYTGRKPYFFFFRMGSLVTASEVGSVLVEGQTYGFIEQ